MRRNDIILCGIILTLGALVSVFYALSIGSKDGKTVVVNVDGSLYKEYDLSINGTFTVETKSGINIIEIKNYAVRVTESDCVGSDCIGMGAISKSGESIVCIPHRVEIYIKGDSSDVDTVAY